MRNEELRRRAFLARTGQYLAFTFAAPYLSLAQPRTSDNPFTLGVASGDPAPDGIVLWTRLAPDPLNGGGMPAGRVEVEWEVAADERMNQIVKKGRVSATPDLAHSVHAEVRGLIPVNYLTAVLMLRHFAAVREGEQVLVHAAAGGVGMAAIQLCRAVGATVIGTASAAKHEILREAGVAHAID
jgi:hypothetical protein